MPRVLLLSNPRSGSTYLQELLNCHPEISITEELLNDEFGLIVNPLEYIQSKLDELPNTITGFKIFPEQLFIHNVNFSELLETIGCTHVIVLYREGLLETLVSRRIADKSGQWYSTEDSKATKTTRIELDDLESYSNQTIAEWNRIGQEWPVDVRPIFIKFENLLTNPVQECQRLLAELSLSSNDVVFNTPSVRQNPASLQEKVSNFKDLPVSTRDAKLNVKDILLQKINVSLQIPPNLLQFAPDREPCAPAGGFRYRVAEPYIPSASKQNAFDAINSGSISSAGYWPREIAKRIRAIFKCPVAQPCSNGFTALMLAMQSANIGEGDEVIMPTMTMVAVPNSVHFLKAKPIFADNASGLYNPSWTEYFQQATDKTKAIIVTHTYGVPVQDIELIAEECKKRNWLLIEDISECVGVKMSTNQGQRLLGTFGDFACASLYANKIIQGGDGGFIVAKEAKYGKRLTSLVNHGFTPSYHFVHFEPAINAKMNGIGAAIATGCLDKLDDVMDHRSQLSNWYRKYLAALPLKLMPTCGAQDTPWVFGVQCESKAERTKARAFLAKHGIETRDFFFNLHLQPAYLPRDGVPPKLPNAEVLGSTGFYLPTHSNLKQDDVQYICGCLRAYFEDSSVEASLVRAVKRPTLGVQLESDGFALQVRKYKESGELSGVTIRGHPYLHAIKLGIEADEIIFTERFDQVQLILQSIKSCLSELKGDQKEAEINKYFRPYLNYFESQAGFEQTLERPWLHVDLNDKLFEESRKISTTTDPETLQLLVWLIQQEKPEIIWEIGSWFGHASVVMAEVCNSMNIDHRIFACDAFRWQPWMQDFIVNSNETFKNGKSFLKLFEENVKPFRQNIEPVIWPYDINELPPILQNNQKPHLIFLDITQDDEDLEQIWSFIKASLIPNKTIILFNGLSIKSIPFFTRHADQLKPFAKPFTMAKAFLFVNQAEEIKKIEEFVPLKRKFKFHSNPGWDHHHRNLFCASIQLLKKHLHSEDAPVVFIPAVEESLCDEPDIFYDNKWVGIIHSVESHPELFYTPDLQRLCKNPRYLAALKNCKGLFTLTSFQAEYLRKNLQDNLHFPIQSLLYPTKIIHNFGESIVPKLMREGKLIDLLHIGSFARDFTFFFDVAIPSNFRKVLVAGDEDSEKMSKHAPKNVSILARLDTEMYEEKLKSSVIFLTLKREGAANTIILECISRNVPILSPDISSCTEYLGKDYPLLYNPDHPHLDELLTPEKISQAISYLKTMNKSKFTQEKFLDDIQHGIVSLSILPESVGNKQFQKFDVTISICSYKRTHHLPQLFHNLWNQDFQGTYQIIIWNNNDVRNGIVRDAALPYFHKSNERKSIQFISSSENHFCSIRFAMPHLIKSDCLLICDDDIIPASNFISFFYSAHKRNPEDVLCLRGHQFLPHELNQADPAIVWRDYDSLRFKDDHQPEQFIHFVHADACLIPKQALQEISSVTMPDSSFSLVDDYWMSFILNSQFSRKLRKLSTNGINPVPIDRTDDSDTPGLALHTRPEVMDARLRLYAYHMVQGWPKWDDEIQPEKGEEQIAEEKKKTFWKQPPQLGFNINSSIDEEGVKFLAEKGIKAVRIGAVGVGGKHYFELCGFLNEPEVELERLEKTVRLLGQYGIQVVITLERRIASVAAWRRIAKRFSKLGNVVGYDLVNEPFTKHENELHWTDVENDVDPDLPKITENVKAMIEAIREVDMITPIILEPTFWGRIDGLYKFPVEEFLKLDTNLIMSVHFYEPMTLTSRVRNKKRYTFPGEIPWFDGIPYSEVTFWEEETIFKKLQKAKSWAMERGISMFVGEYGICRDIEGAGEYLKAVKNSCKKLGMSCFAFSFRDPDWEAMDYEFGREVENCSIRDQDNNGLMMALFN